MNSLLQCLEQGSKLLVSVYVGRKREQGELPFQDSSAARIIAQLLDGGVGRHRGKKVDVVVVVVAVVVIDVRWPLSFRRVSSVPHERRTGVERDTTRE